MAYAYMALLCHLVQAHRMTIFNVAVKGGDNSPAPRKSCSENSKAVLGDLQQRVLYKNPKSMEIKIKSYSSL